MKRSFRVVRLGSVPGHVCFVGFHGKPRATYRWSWRHSRWVRRAPKWLADDTPEFPAMLQ